LISPQSTTRDLRSDPGYPSLKSHILQMTGLSYYADKDEDLIQRIARRLDELTETDCKEYLDLLRDSARGDAELDHLIEQLTVGETSFFRHAELFDGLRARVLPDILARNRKCRRLRIWSAGCSIGAEAYSIAILLAREFHREVEGWDVSILGTDINRHFLARASQGIFRKWDFRGVPQSQIEDCFEKRGDESIIRSEYRRCVSFQYHNLVRHTFPSLINNLVAFDLILCRNVLIYFNRELIERLVSQFHKCLVDGGWLLVGHAEPNIELFRAFHSVNVPGAVLYQRHDSAAQTPSHATSSSPPAVIPTIRATESIAPLGAVAKAAATPSEPTTLRKGYRHTLWPLLPTPRGSSSQQRPSIDRHEKLLRIADRGDLESAMEGYVALVAEEPMNAMLHFYIALIAEQLGDHRNAETSLRRTVYLDPSNALAHYYSGLLWQKKGLRSQADRAYRTVLDLLSNKPEDDLIPDADGLTVAELNELTRMQLEVMRNS